MIKIIPHPFPVLVQAGITSRKIKSRRSLILRDFVFIEVVLIKIPA